MSFLARLLPYWKWIAGVAGVLVLAGSLIGGVVYIKRLWIENEIARRSYEQTAEQLDAVTRELEEEKARREQESSRVDQAEKEASESDDADDVAPESYRDLFNRLYNH